MSARWAIVHFDPRTSSGDAEDIRSAIRSFAGVKSVGQVTFDPQPFQTTDKVDAKVGLHPSAIIAETARQFGVRPEAFRGASRHRTVVHARHIAMYLIRERLAFSFPEIGKIFAKDHSTVMAGYRKLAMQALTDERTVAYIAEIEARLAERSAAA